MAVCDHHPPLDVMMIISLLLLLVTTILEKTEVQTVTVILHDNVIMKNEFDLGAETIKMTYSLQNGASR